MPTGAAEIEQALHEGRVADVIAAADAALSDGDTPDRKRVAAALGAAYAARGHWSSAASLYRSLPDPDHLFWASIAHLLTGQRNAADEALATGEAQVTGAPAPSSRALQLLARGLHESVRGPAAAAVEMLTEAAELASARPDAPTPDSPHAVASVVACEAHEFDAGDLLARRALAQGIGGRLLSARHQLLAAWVAMRAGKWSEAQQTLDALAGTDLEARDMVATAALESGLALRRGDLDRLLAARERILGAVNLHPVDLLALPFFSELLGAAARLEALGDLSRQASSAEALLEALGRPPLWTLAAAWIRFRTAAMAGSTDDARASAHLLASIEAPLPRLRPLGEAATAWLGVLDGEVDRGFVETAADGLDAVGLRWEATQLLGAAAVRTTDPTTGRALLVRARDLRGSLASSEGDVGAVGLTEREREIGACVLTGMSYKAIGEHLYISAKTVEHHVARIKTKLGAGTRAEMRALLRRALEAE